MANVGPIRTDGWEDTPATFLARLTRDDAGTDTPVVQADIASITVVVTDDDVTETLASTPVDKTTAVYDTLQTGTIWGAEDATGYNFKHQVPGSAFPGPGQYHVEYLVTLTGGTTFPVVFLHKAESLQRS